MLTQVLCVLSVDPQRNAVSGVENRDPPNIWIVIHGKKLRVFLRSCFVETLTVLRPALCYSIT